MSMRPRGCDYCSTPNSRQTPLRVIPLTHTPNGESIKAELCDECIRDIVKYAKGEGV